MSTSNARARWSERKLIVHAGISKTGSTALQEFFADNRARLKEQGILVPSYSGVGNHRLYRAIYQSKAALRNSRLCHPWGRSRAVHPNLVRLRAIRSLTGALLQTSVSRPEQVLISSENFAYAPIAEESDRFLSNLKRFAAHVQAVIYVRDPIDWFISKSLQSLKRGVCAPPEQGIQILSRVRKFSEAFMSHHGMFPAIHEYSRRSVPGQDVREEFMKTHFPHVSTEELFFSNSTSNPSISPEVGLILSELRLTLKTVKDRHSRPRIFLQAREALTREDRELGTLFPTLRPEIVEYIQRGTENQTSWFRDQFGINLASSSGTSPVGHATFDHDYFQEQTFPEQVRRTFVLNVEREQALRRVAVASGILPY